MTYAPQPLLDARTYLQEHTGLPWVSLGIVGSDGHHRTGTSYHIGWSHLHSWAYSRQHPRDTKLRTEAASALDIGDWSTSGLRELTAFLVAEARAGRLPDVREIIGPGSDGRAYRWAAENGWRAQLRSRGDSHETHCHISYYRDSEHRDKTAPFRAFFEGEDMPTASEIVDELMNRVIDKVNPESGTHPRMQFENYIRWIHHHTVEDKTTSKDQLEQVAAGQAAIMARLDGQEDGPTRTMVREELDRHRETLATVLERLETRLVEALPDVPAEQVRAAVRAELETLVLTAEGGD